MCNQTNSLTNSINFVNSSVERGFSSVAYETQRQTCDIINAMNAGFNAIKEREDAREIQNLRDQLEQAKADTREANILAAIKGTKCINARYDTTTQTVCGSVGQRNCCCNRVATTTPTPATTDTVTDSIEDARMVDP